LKKILILLAIVVLLKPVFPVVEYLVNYDYVSKVLCVNKDKPMMHCNGKCHLMKELAKAAESEKPLSSDKKSGGKQETETLYCQSPLPLLSFRLRNDSARKSLDYYLNLYTLLSGSSVFHPPSLA
jgi:hypothetical protein